MKLIINQQVKSKSVPPSRVWKIGDNGVHAIDVMAMDGSIIYDIPYEELEVYHNGGYWDYSEYKLMDEPAMDGVFNDDIIAQATKPKPRTKAEIVI